MLRSGDVVVGISHSGATRETIEVVAEAGSRGATAIVVTSVPRSPLAELADLVLLTAAPATSFRPDALSARHPQLVAIDLLFIAVAQRMHEWAHAAFQLTARAVDAHRARDAADRTLFAPASAAPAAGQPPSSARTTHLTGRQSRRNA
jgi:DNA-binding MurR/RpiR family transcriptional regulator